jgi:exopolyphosphatase / guanosine-5'-triphosphate,3'-diphosphate pyrophosphatase
MAGAAESITSHDGSPVRCACVDIGSNTTRLLVADTGGARALRTLAAERRFVRLPEGATGGAVGPERAARLAAVVASQVALAREHGAERIRVVGTAALRRCADRDEVVAAVGRAAGLPVRILAPSEEAALAFAGATHGLRDGRVDPATPIAVADVGGGSTELMVGTLRDGVRWSASRPVGSGVLAAGHLSGPGRSDPPSPQALAAVAGAAAAALACLAPPASELALAVGGGAASLSRLCGSELSEEVLTEALERLCAGPAAVVAAELGLHVERVRLLPAGLVLLRAAARTLGGPLRVAGGGLREGVVLDEVARTVPQ